MGQQLPRFLDRLEAVHGPPEAPRPRSAFEWLVWERCAYLVPDERRAAVFAALEKRVGLSAEALLAAPRERIAEVVKPGGMHPERRAGELVAIAEEVRDRHGGDLEAALDAEPERAVRELKRFRGIGEPGAEWILVATGRGQHAALESNGLRVLCRLGVVDEQKDYARTYRAAREALASHLMRGSVWLARMRTLLRGHGKEVCRSSDPACEQCPLSRDCRYAIEEG